MFSSFRHRSMLIVLASLVAVFNIGVFCSSSVGQCPNGEGQNGDLVLSTLCRQAGQGGGLCLTCSDAPSNLQDLTVYNNNWIHRPPDPPNGDSFPNPSAPTMVLCWTVKSCDTTQFPQTNCKKAAGTCGGFALINVCSTGAYAAPTPIQQGDYAYCD